MCRVWLPVTSMAVKLLDARLVGETGMWMGCGHHADRFKKVLLSA